jgi:cytochrome bd-type quinol oxidase subunit 2
VGRRDNLDEREWSGIPEEKRRLGFEWGLASLLMGGLLALMALVLFISNILIFLDAGQRLDPTSLELANIAAIVGIPCFIGLCVCTIVFAIRGMRGARRYDMPMALPVSGLLLSIAALILWLVVGVDLIAILQSFRAGGL